MISKTRMCFGILAMLILGPTASRAQEKVKPLPAAFVGGMPTDPTGMAAQPQNGMPNGNFQPEGDQGSGYPQQVYPNQYPQQGYPQQAYPQQPYNPTQQDPRRTRSVGIASASFNCPFRPTDSRTQEIWEGARTTLMSLQAKDQTCKNALDPLQTSLRTQISPAFLSDPNALQESRLREIRARIITITSNPELNVAGELENLQEEETRLRRQIDASTMTRNNQARDQAAQMSLDQVRAILTSIPTIQAACQGADANVGMAVARSGLQVFSAASPLLFGALTPISTIADIFSSLAGALSGPSASERGLRFMSNVEDLDNLACFYFHVQKTYCDAKRTNAEEFDADLGRIVQVRRLFEEERSPLGRRMRTLFNEVYGEDPRRSLGPVLDRGIPQYCGLMSTLPGRSGRCTQANQQQLGAPFDSCTYMTYYEQGTEPSQPGGDRRKWPSSQPSGPLSTGATGSR